MLPLIHLDDHRHGANDDLGMHPAQDGIVP
jgi:hypothetical protein